MVSPQGGHHSSDASHVESQLLPKVHLHLYHMKVVVGFLITYLRQLVVVLLKYRHCRRENRSEELSFGLDTAAIDVVHLAHLLRHRLEVEVLTVAERESSVSGEDEEVANPVQLALKLVCPQTLQLVLGQRLTFLALAAADSHQLVRILLDVAHLEQLANPFAQVLVVAVAGDIRSRAVMEPSIERHNLLRRQVAVGVQLTKSTDSINHTLLVLACSFTQFFCIKSNLHVFEKALFRSIRLLISCFFVRYIPNTCIYCFCRLCLLFLTGIVLVKIFNVGLLAKHRHCNQNILTFLYNEFCFI